MRTTRIGAIAAATGVLALAAVTAAADLDGSDGATVTRGADRAASSWPREVRVLAGGDILTESPVRSAAAALGEPVGRRFDFAPLLDGDGLFAWADLAICHLELPVGRAGGPYGFAGRSPFGGNLLLAPYELASGVAHVGFDRCSTASNHSYDLGAEGIASTLDALDAHGIDHVGTARHPDEAVSEPFDVAGVRVAHLSYTRYSNTVLPAGGWAVSYARSAAEVTTDVRAARSAGAEIVIVSLHLSQEMQTGPTVDDRAFAESVVAAGGVDAIVHHGPHVVQPLELVDGVPVFWSLGNHISGMGIGGTGRYEDQRTLDGLVAALRFVERPDGGFRADADAIAICTDPVTRRVRHAATAIADATLSPDERSRAAACLARTERVVGLVR